MFSCNGFFSGRPGSGREGACKAVAKDDRSQLILEYLKVQKTASVEEIAERFYISPATVRRDLARMEKLGQVKRTHGGVLLAENSEEQAFLLRVSRNAEEKHRTVSLALSHLPEFSSLFVDNSSTCMLLLEQIDLTHKTVVTNGLQAATMLSKRDDVNVIIPGGELRFSTGDVTSSMTVRMLSEFRFDLTLCSCAAFSAQGTFEHSLDTMQIKQLAFGQSRRTVLLADHTKFGQSAMYRTQGLSDYSLVVSDLDDMRAMELRGAGVRLVNR